VDHRGDVALSQKTIKAFCTAALRAIRWAISEEMVTAEETKITSLAETDPLADCRPKRPKKRHPAYQPDIDAVLKELTPTLATAVMIQRATMMRSSELLTMRPMDLRKSGTITLKSGARVRLEWETEQAIERGDIKKGETLWVYVPESHKTAHHGIDKVIPIVPAVQRLLERLPPRDADKPFISPQESLAEFRAMQRARRKTKVQPSQVSRSKAKPGRVPASDQYQQTQYRQAIIRACHRAGVPVWTPHQLRHLGVTDVVDRTGDIRAAQEMAGHSSPRTTEGYTAKTMVKAFRAAAALVRG
jgi:integrase